LARRVVRRLSAPYRIRGTELAVGAAVGVAFASGSDGGALNVDLLLGTADRALYRAKRGGRCTWRTYELDAESLDEMHPVSCDRATMRPRAPGDLNRRR
jgi:predicted signal transduction protein with EAL and GGDEF domain